MKLLLSLFLTAGFTANAQTDTRYSISYEGGTKTHQICGTVDNTNQLLSFQNIGEIEAQATLSWETSITEAVAVQIDEVEGAGKSPIWDEFYTGSLSRQDRIRLLRNAIKGIGDGTASLVFPYFYGTGIKKARTWREFSERIKRAGQDIEYRTCETHELGDHCIRANSWTNQVLNTYANENRINLGYTKEQITGVSIVTRTERGSRPIPEKNKSLRYVIQFTGFKLLPGECESVSVSYNGRGISEKMNTGYNIAQASHQSEKLAEGRDAVILVSAQGRSQIGATPGLVRVSLNGTTASLSKSEAFSLMTANQEFNTRCRLLATLSLNAKEKRAWYDWGGKTRSIGTKTIAVTNNTASQQETVSEATIDTTKEELEYYTSLSFAQGCPFFNSRAF